MTTHPDSLTFEDDIPVSAAQSAHQWTSFVPEDRAKQERKSYSDQLCSDFDALSELANTDDKHTALLDEFARYRAGYKARTLAELSAKSRCASTMITGGSNFNVRRAEKANGSADKRGCELTEYRDRALKAISRVLCPELAPIMTGDADAGERLTAKIEAAEQERDTMKAANAAARRSGQPSPYASFTLTNLSANIRRMKERIAHVEQVKAIPATTAQGAAARFEDVPQDNRVRLFFPGKPEDAVRSNLKSNGFRWTPSLGCWQAYRNQWAIDAARQLAGIEEK